MALKLKKPSTKKAQGTDASKQAGPQEEKRAELSELQQQINVVEIQSKYIEKVQSYQGKELSDYMEKIAKEELGYVGEGERIFINVAGDQ